MINKNEFDNIYPKNQNEFDNIYPKKLNAEQHTVLGLFLQGDADLVIAKKITRERELEGKKKKTTKKATSIRHDILNICKIFGIQNEEGKSEWLRPDLIELFRKYKPEMVKLDGVISPPIELEYPNGPVSLDSNFYIERFRIPDQSIESECYEYIQKRGAFLKIKSPQKTGKTSLLLRILDFVEEQDYQVIKLDFKDFGSDILADKSKFYQRFCQEINDQINLTPIMDNYHKKGNYKSYFQEQILDKIETQLVLVIEELDYIFPYVETAPDFLSMLRSWNEETKKHKSWHKLRMILVYAANNYVQIPDKKSPFNVGTDVELPEFNQVNIANLAKIHQLKFAEDLADLTSLIDSHPYLLRLAFYALAKKEITLKYLLETPAQDIKLYQSYLQENWNTLNKYPEIKAAFQQIITSKEPILLTNETSEFILVAAGLVKKDQGGLVITCKLYQDYFAYKFERYPS